VFVTTLLLVCGQLRVLGALVVAKLIAVWCAGFVRSVLV